jgi:hypothetical protein
MKTDEPFLIPMTLLTASCLAAMVYGCGGCVASADDLGPETVSDSSETLDGETSDFSLDMAAEPGEELDMPPQPDPGPAEPTPSEESCTVVTDACCWCPSHVCVVGLDAAMCLEAGGEMAAGCVLVSLPPNGVDGPHCYQFQCV